MSSSLSPTQAKFLADLLRNRRQALGWTMRAVAARAGNNIATISELEAASSLNPRPDTVSAIARALGLPVTDVFVTVGWLPPDELPTMQPYLRSKYAGLDDRDIEAIADYMDLRRRAHGTVGPQAGEDERSEYT